MSIPPGTKPLFVSRFVLVDEHRGAEALSSPLSEPLRFQDAQRLHARMHAKQRQSDATPEERARRLSVRRVEVTVEVPHFDTGKSAGNEVLRVVCRELLRTIARLRVRYLAALRAVCTNQDTSRYDVQHEAIRSEYREGLNRATLQLAGKFARLRVNPRYSAARVAAAEEQVGEFVVLALESAGTFNTGALRPKWVEALEAATEKVRAARAVAGKSGTPSA